MDEAEEAADRLRTKQPAWQGTGTPHSGAGRGVIMVCPALVPQGQWLRTALFVNLIRFKNRLVLHERRPRHGRATLARGAARVTAALASGPS